MKCLVPSLVIFVASDCLLQAAEPWAADARAGREELEQQWPLIAHPPEQIGIRGVFRFALEAAGLQWHPERIDAALGLARSMQDLDPASATYGNFRWRKDQAGVFDPNAVEFSMVQATLLRRKYSASLDAEGVHRLDDLIRTGIEGMRRHSVKVSYTNMALLRANNFIAAGEVLHLPDVAAEGDALFDAWLAHTEACGIGEYGAVTYYGVDMDALGLLANDAERPETRAKARAALRYLWTDIAANWWTPGARYGGPNQRSYDYLYGRGYLEAHTWAQGWLPQRPELEGAGWLMGEYRRHLVTFYRACTWFCPPEVTESLRAELPRTVAMRWGPEPYQQTVNYLSDGVSLGSSGASSARDERTLVGNLGSTPAIPQVVLFMDGRDDPYGTRKQEEKQGAMKALHLTPFIATVQKDNELLQLLSIEPSDFRKGSHPEVPSCLISQLIFPSAAEVSVDGRAITPGSEAHPTSIPRDSVVGLRLGHAAILVRVLTSDGDGPSPAAIGFVRDDPADPAQRISVVHARGTPTRRGTLAVWMRAVDHLDSPGYAQAIADFARAPAQVHREGDQLSLLASAFHGPLGLSVNLANSKRLELEGGDVAGLLCVNGREIGRPLLAESGKP